MIGIQLPETVNSANVPDFTYCAYFWWPNSSIHGVVVFDCLRNLLARPGLIQVP